MQVNESDAGDGTRRQTAKTGVPFLQGVLPLRWSQVPSELLAGATLAAVAIPEVMGYTQIAGMPVITGLYTILIPTALFALFGSSRHLVVGADSATAAILSGSLVGVAVAGSPEYTALASVLALLSAVFVFAARAIGLGFMADFLSRTVLIGFLSGVGLQVAMGQLAGMTGIEGASGNAVQKLTYCCQHFRESNPWAVAIAVATVAAIAVCKRYSKKLPGALIVVVLAIACSWAFDWASHIDVLGAVPSGLPELGLPDVDWKRILHRDLLETAFAMFVVILTQSAATSRAYASRYNESFSEDTDLIGLAMANVGAGLSGTFVVNGSPTKTQIVDSAGGRSQLSLLFTVVIVLVVLLFLTGPLAFIPECVLAAIVFLIGIELIDLKGLRQIQRQRPSEFWVAIVTLVTVLVADVKTGILLAIVLSLVEHTRHGYRPRNIVLVLEEDGQWRARPVHSRAHAVPGLIIYRFSHSLYYANSRQFSEEIADLVEGSGKSLKRLCIDASAIADVDFTAADVLRSTARLLQEQNIELVVSSVLPNSTPTDPKRSQKRSRSNLSPLSRSIEGIPVFTTINDVVADFRQAAS